MMRTVLAIDEMLAHAVAAQLPGEIEVFGHMEMRDRGHAVGAELRERVLRSPSVLVIGARAWDPCDMLKKMRLPYEVPVVVVVPSITPERERMSFELDAWAMLPADGSVTGLSGAVADEAVLGWLWTRKRRPRPLAPVLLDPQPRRPVARIEAVVVRPEFPAWKQSAG